MDQKPLSSLVGRIRFKSLPFDMDDMACRLADRMNRPEIIQVVYKTGMLWKFAAVAASLALLFVTGWLVSELKKTPSHVMLETTAVADAKTKVILPDSTSVWLNANSTLRYPVSFSGSERHVELSGEAFFEVSKNKKLPFVVSTHGIDIKVLGTSFSVDACENYTEVSLVSGSVSLHKNNTASGEPDIMLKPGESVRFSLADNSLVSSTVRPEQATSWVTGQFVFRESSLEEIMHELQRAFHVKIYIDNPDLNDMKFDADFTDRETLDEILEILRISARYTIDRHKGEIHLK